MYSYKYARVSANENVYANSEKESPSAEDGEFHNETTAFYNDAINSRDEHGYTALICAVQRDHIRVVDLLLTHNAR